MDQLQKLTNQIRLGLLAALIVNDGLIFGVLYFGHQASNLALKYLELGVIVVALLLAIMLAIGLGAFAMQPLRLLWQSILHISPEDNQVAAPKDHAGLLGKAVVENLMRHVYQLASVAAASNDQTGALASSNNPVATNAPLPLLALDKDKKIVFASDATAHYLDKPEAEIINQDVYGVLDLSFDDEQTLDNWLAEVAEKTVTATRFWERVRLNRQDQANPKYLDLAAHYNQANPDNYEILLALFDHTKTYSEDIKSLSFISLAVHELRTPLTLLRGYIEALEEDLQGKLPPADNEFLQRMEVAGQQLAKLINNVLNVAHVEGDQFLVTLKAENWPAIVQSVCQDMALRAQLHQITIEQSVPADLPAAAADHTSSYEVLSNLLDNAIKYSPDGGKIIIKAELADDGMIQTTVQDSGIGIPANLVPNLFEKFYRSHRSQAQVSGTGLGLYLSKAIVTAHGGNIWVSSKEGQGTTFGFSLTPFDKLPTTPDNSQPETRTAHGWIKNHSLYRR
ncbi:MAG: sensor histidine kinase [Candidatus Saccharimonadales bacterium]